MRKCCVVLNERVFLWYSDICLEVAEPEKALNAFNSNIQNLSTGNKWVFSRIGKR